MRVDVDVDAQILGCVVEEFTSSSSHLPRFLLF